MISSILNDSSHLEAARYSVSEADVNSHLTKIGIVGAGVVGTSVAIMMARAHMKSGSNENVCISLIDDHKPGFGIPYRTYSQNEALAQTYMLNQPNNRMAFDPTDPLEFCRYINAESPESVVNEFSSRDTYGQFVADALNETQCLLWKNKSHCSIDWVKARVVDVDHHMTAAEVISKNGVSYLQDIVIIATGHDCSSFMASMKDAPGFIDFPCDLDDLQKCLKGKKSGVLVIGTSQSQIDAIASLKAIGYKGKIHSISRRNATPWKFVPQHHPLDFDMSAYKLNVLTPEAITSTDPRLAGEPGSEERLQYLLGLEVEAGKNKNIGAGFVYAKVLSKGPQLQGPHLQSKVIQQFLSFVAAKFGNPTPPQRFAMLQELEESGILNVHQGAVSTDNLTQTKTGQFTLTGVDSLKGLAFDAVLNGAAFARAPIDSDGKLISPLLKRIAERGLLNSYLKNNFQAGQQTSRIYMANGPNTNLHRWGIETFRDHNSNMAQNIINEINSLEHSFSKRSERTLTTSTAAYKK